MFYIYNSPETDSVAPSTDVVTVRLVSAVRISNIYICMYIYMYIYI